MMKPQWNAGNVRLKFCEESFLLNKRYLQLSQLLLLPVLSKVVITWNPDFFITSLFSLLWIYFLYIYSFKRYHSRKLRSLGAPKSRRAMFSIQSHFSLSLKGSLPSVWIHKPKRERRGRGRRKKKQQTGILRILLRHVCMAGSCSLFWWYLSITFTNSEAAFAA